jgi:hypothetical protein
MDQMSQQSSPDADFKLVHEVHHQLGIQIKTDMRKTFRKRIL